MSKFLFTTLPSNDLGLLTRSLPIANELKKFDHEIFFSSPAKAPDKLIKDAGFDEVRPHACNLQNELIELTADTERAFFICRKPVETTES